MISLIVAYAKNNVIGKDGKIPWNIEGEQSRFKELTTNNIVIMGRKTFEEIYQKLQKPLPNRINIVISKTKKYDFDVEMMTPDDLRLNENGECPVKKCKCHKKRKQLFHKISLQRNYLHSGVWSMIRMISLSVSDIPSRARRPMLRMVFSTPLVMIPSPP